MTMTAEQLDLVLSERKQQTKLLAEAIQTKNENDIKWRRAALARLNRWIKSGKVGN